MKLHIVIAAFNKPYATRALLDSFIMQSFENWEAFCIHDGPPPALYTQMIVGYANEPRIHITHNPNKDSCYGHKNRRDALMALKGDPGDFVLMTNCDNYYMPVFAEWMLREATPGVGVVYCNTIHSYFDYTIHKSQLKLNHIDLGAFIVRLDVAQAVGFPHVEVPAADGLYAEEADAYCKEHGLRTVYLDKNIFIHN